MSWPLKQAALLALMGLGACTTGPIGPQVPAYVVFFTPFSAQIDAPARGVLADAAQAARTAPGRTVRVLGYAAPSPETTPAADLQLSQERSHAVARALVAEGVSQSRVVELPKGSRGGDPGIESRRVEIEIGS